MKSYENFNRVSERELRELLERKAQRKYLPLELLYFDTKETSEILHISTRLLSDLTAERRINFHQLKPRSIITISALDIIDYQESIKIRRL